MNRIEFLDENGTFCVKQPDNSSGLYFPIAGEKGLKSAVTPTLGGDAKLDQNTFLLEPVSIENLHNNRSSRNFWCHIYNRGNWSATGNSARQMAERFTDLGEESELTAGFMWHSMKRVSRKYQLQSEITSFVPVDENLEIMLVKLTNIGKQAMDFAPIAAVPIYGRSAENIRDHRHVTSLLHRIEVTEHGVQVMPTLSFDERGHQLNHMKYYVSGIEADGSAPESFYPTVEEFIGEGGNFEIPRAVIEDRKGVCFKEAQQGKIRQGKEAMGGIRFATKSLQPQEKATYIILMGLEEKAQEIQRLEEKFHNAQAVEQELEQVKQYWIERVNVKYHTGDRTFDQYMKWVSFQPILRRIYGCSFLPHHDYGKGGRGWRDLWQDCLALLLMNPSGVKEMLLDNCGGIRMDGTNATIIGNRQGEFIADRNNITRVWMDHGVWPTVTVKLYLNVTGDLSLLQEESVYFRDKQICRGTKVAENFDENADTVEIDEKGNVYRGSVYEHLLLENLTAIHEVGAHHMIRLRGADWNDAMDMAAENGESAAFTNAYAGNLSSLADMAEQLEIKYGTKEIELASEIVRLLDGAPKSLERYLEECSQGISGEKTKVGLRELASKLRSRADQIREQIRQQEWVTDDKGNGWFNGYYDNHKRQVEGQTEKGVRMMLTSQVFAIMAGTATDSQIQQIVKSADQYLYEEKIGGYRLNTDFGEVKTDLGRMFGFAYGEKENGAVFSHMAVMYANALYQRGYAKEGYKALMALQKQAADFEHSGIYPGIPEYFNGSGRGLYHYLTGAASWYMLTVITEMFGVQGHFGNVHLQPKLQREQFDQEGNASLELTYGGVKWRLIYENPEHKEYGTYQIQSALLDGRPLQVEKASGKIALSKEEINALDPDIRHEIRVRLV